MPLHLRNAVTAFNRKLGYGRDYKYAHYYAGHVVEQQYLPDALMGRRWYTPGDQGHERELAERWERGPSPPTPLPEGEGGTWLPRPLGEGRGEGVPRFRGPGGQTPVNVAPWPPGPLKAQRMQYSALRGDGIPALGQLAIRWIVRRQRRHKARTCWIAFSRW